MEGKSGGGVPVASPPVIEPRPAPDVVAGRGGVVRVGRIFYGPMPSPEDMRAYGDIYAKAPEEFFAAFRGERKHRHRTRVWNRIIFVGLFLAVLVPAVASAWTGRVEFAIALCFVLIAIVGQGVFSNIFRARKNGDG